MKYNISGEVGEKVMDSREKIEERLKEILLYDDRNTADYEGRIMDSDIELLKKALADGRLALDPPTAGEIYAILIKVLGDGQPHDNGEIAEFISSRIRTGKVGETGTKGKEEKV
jgi:hypothetical protein